MDLIAWCNTQWKCAHDIEYPVIQNSMEEDEWGHIWNPIVYRFDGND